MSTPSLLRVDIAAKPVGSFFGGKFSTSIKCPKCGQPGLLVRKAIRDGKTKSEFAHQVALRLDDRNEPVADYGTLCEVKA